MMGKILRKLERRDTSDRRFIGNFADQAGGGMRRGKRRAGDRREYFPINWLGGIKVFSLSWFWIGGIFKPH